MCCLIDELCWLKEAVDYHLAKSVVWLPNPKEAGSRLSYIGTVNNINRYNIYWFLVVAWIQSTVVIMYKYVLIYVLNLSGSLSCLYQDVYTHKQSVFQPEFQFIFLAQCYSN